MFKKMIRIMIIGMIAALGAEAEAHWVVIKGLCYWHSGECVRKDGDGDQKDPIPDSLSAERPPIGELVLMPRRVEILCPGDVVQSFDLSDQALALVAQKTIVQSDMTRAFDRSGPLGKIVEWGVFSSDGHFVENFTCAGGLQAEDVILREMDVEMNLYVEIEQPVHSAWRATCTLPNRYNFPKNIPPRGTLFACANVSTCHGEKECFAR